MTATNRLHNMEVEEISLVNRPANKRKFLIVKDEKGEAAFEVVRDEEGGVTMVAKAEGVPAEALASAGGDAKFKLTKDMKTALVASTTTALEKLTEFAKSLAEAEEVEKGEVSDDLANSILAIATTAADIVNKAKKKPEEEEEDGKSKTEKNMMCPACGYAGVPGEGGVCPKCGKPMEAAAKTAAQKTLEKAADAHKALLDEKVQAITTLADDISKNAATMDPKDLREKMRQMERIGWKMDSVAQVVNVNKSDEDAAKQLTDIGDAIAKMLPRGIEQGTRADINAGAGSIPDGSGVPLMTAEQMFANIKGLSEVMKSHAEVIEKNAELEKQLVELKKRADKRVTKSVGMPTSAPSDGGAGGRRFEGWPLDMNP